ncbi:MAG TPA: hypothetical protein VJ695_07655, partial [Nitrososphaera sp.]|nr:hypothetical protein [Nitrososphaera sp.]
MSSSHSPNEGSKGYSSHMRGVALGILVMGVSLAAVIVLWATIGYQGPDFSTQVMERQQEWLHKQYGLPPLPDLSPEMLQIPPSLRNIAQQQGEDGTAQTAAGGNQTAAGGNQTAETTTGGGATTGGGGGGGTGNASAPAAAGGGGGPTLNILEGAAVQGSPDYDPDELTASTGAQVNVVNQDTV